MDLGKISRWEDLVEPVYEWVLHDKDFTLDLVERVTAWCVPFQDEPRLLDFLCRIARRGWDGDMRIGIAPTKKIGQCNLTILRSIGGDTYEVVRRYSETKVAFGAMRKCIADKSPAHLAPLSLRLVSDALITLEAPRMQSVMPLSLRDEPAQKLPGKRPSKRPSAPPAARKGAAIGRVVPPKPPKRAVREEIARASGKKDPRLIGESRTDIQSPKLPATANLPDPPKSQVFPGEPDEDGWN